MKMEVKIMMEMDVDIEIKMKNLMKIMPITGRRGIIKTLNTQT